MKKILLVLFALSLPILGFSQFGKNAKLKKSYEQDRLERISEGWDIVPFPGEAPQDILRFNADILASNWGVELILPASLKSRLQTECTHKVVVKIFDTGGHSNHPDLQQGQLPGSNFAGGTLEDAQGHGTHVAGIIAGNNGLGVLDVLIDKGLVTWKPVKVLADNGSGQFSWVAAAVTAEDVENKNLLAVGTYVVGTMSLGGGTSKQADVETALKNSTTLGVLYTVATGNTSGPGVQYPGNSVYVVGIGSLDNTNPLIHSAYTSTGPELWISEPGRSIQSTYLNNGYASLSGTSMATPFGASCVAIALSKWGNTNLKTPAQLRNYLAWCASDLETAGFDQNTGWGIVFIKSILDKDPKLAPDMGNPNPTPDPNPPSHISRTITFSIDGSWSMYWNNDLGQSVDFTGTGVDCNTFSTNTRREVRAQTTDKLTITHLEIEVPNSTNLSGVEFDLLIKNVNSFFTNRGLLLESGSDYGDATYWTAYFLELILQQQMPTKQSVNVIRIDAKDVKQRPVVWYNSQLKHWPLQ